MIGRAAEELPLLDRGGQVMFHDDDDDDDDYDDDIHYYFHVCDQK